MAWIGNGDAVGIFVRTIGLARDRFKIGVATSSPTFTEWSGSTGELRPHDGQKTLNSLGTHRDLDKKSSYRRHTAHPAKHAPSPPHR